MPGVVSQHSSEHRTTRSGATCTAQPYFGQACPIVLRADGQRGSSVARIAGPSTPPRREHVLGACDSKWLLFEWTLYAWWTGGRFD